MLLDLRSLVEVTGAFDAAFMAAIVPPWPGLAFSPPQVVASGMTPPDLIPT